jgi:hypothetical protein
MALIVNTPIGTDRGLATNAYIRIGNYMIEKAGRCKFDIHIYKSKEDAIIADSNVATYGVANHLTAYSLEIGKELTVDLTREIIKTVTVPNEKPVTVQVERTIGTRSYMTTETQVVVEDATYQTTLKVPDWTQLENHNIFEFGYAKLKDRLSELYGAENIEDDHTTAVGEGPFAEAYDEDIRVRNEGNI